MSIESAIATLEGFTDLLFYSKHNFFVVVGYITSLWLIIYACIVGRDYWREKDQRWARRWISGFKETSDQPPAVRYAEIKKLTFKNFEDVVVQAFAERDLQPTKAQGEPYWLIKMGSQQWILLVADIGDGMTESHAKEFMIRVENNASAYHGILVHRGMSTSRAATKIADCGYTDTISGIAKLNDLFDGKAIAVSNMKF